MRRIVEKMKTEERCPLQACHKSSLIAFVAGSLTIFILLSISDITESMWIMAPFGASCVLTYVLWDAPFSQPRNIIGGHMLTSFLAIAVKALFGNSHIVLVLTVGLGLGLMIMTKTTHPPAGANPIVVFLGNESWGFLINPVLSGATVVVIMAIITNNLLKQRRYPRFWL